MKKLVKKLVKFLGKFGDLVIQSYWVNGLIIIGGVFIYYDHIYHWTNVEGGSQALGLVMAVWGHFKYKNK
jgi:hypothetical protein